MMNGLPRDAPFRNATAGGWRRAGWPRNEGMGGTFPFTLLNENHYYFDLDQTGMGDSHPES
jgi:hypothetical protein